MLEENWQSLVWQVPTAGRCQMLALSWAHMWVPGRLSAGPPPCTAIAEHSLANFLKTAISPAPHGLFHPRQQTDGELAVPQFLEAIPVRLHSQNSPDRKCPQVSSSMCISNSYRHMLGFPKNFLAVLFCFGVLAVSSNSASISGGRVMGSRARVLFLGAPNLSGSLYLVYTGSTLRGNLSPAY